MNSYQPRHRGTPTPDSRPGHPPELRSDFALGRDRDHRGPELTAPSRRPASGGPEAPLTRPPGAVTYPVRITFSIVPDGTSIGSAPATCSGRSTRCRTGRSGSSRRPPSGEEVANINLVQVPDNERTDRLQRRSAGRLQFWRHPNRRHAAVLWAIGVCLPAPRVQRWDQCRRHLLQHGPVVADQRHHLRLLDRRHPRVRPRLGHGPLADRHSRHVCLLRRH